MLSTKSPPFVRSSRAGALLRKRWVLGPWVIFIILIIISYTLPLLLLFIGFYAGKKENFKDETSAHCGGNYLMALLLFGPFVCDVPILVDVIKISFGSHRKYHTMDIDTDSTHEARTYTHTRVAAGWHFKLFTVACSSHTRRMRNLLLTFIWLLSNLPDLASICLSGEMGRERKTNEWINWYICIWLFAELYTSRALQEIVNKKCSRCKTTSTNPIKSC